MKVSIMTAKNKLRRKKDPITTTSVKNKLAETPVESMNVYIWADHPSRVTILNTCKIPTPTLSKWKKP